MNNLSGKELILMDFLEEYLESKANTSSNATHWFTKSEMIEFAQAYKKRLLSKYDDQYISDKIATVLEGKTIEEIDALQGWVFGFEKAITLLNEDI